ncbi:hypothetical protein P152DRAFT_459205 [Eremomyces bilateralis CBS 781.70]|uniref:Malate dehydrogenase n=1 Tax=Eremomyces bilateralis CBS 781.70 TaxID=1392243 RepID=A0A6G1G1Q5_9PEZI|nr:uncharacterized protein P152DRAFT_459205 [Eremomyces bilateralis CBS 781.70]KAF1811739.1 hypothetical protein P152DRAFT_459205 [Eremomyces bilateralis CBS 781.70]
MLFTTIPAFTFLLTSLATLSAAAPTLDVRQVNARSWSEPEEKYYHAVGDRVARFVRTANFPAPPACNIENAPMNRGALPPPSPGLVLSHVVVGRGTQNFTCDTTNASAIPVQVGAVATLFNSSCIAGLYPELLSLMPPVAIRHAKPADADGLAPSNLWLSGHHFFTAGGVPFFSLNSRNGDYGQVGCKKDGATPAPDPKNVPWLKMSTAHLDGIEATYSEVYRLNTVGGQPPETCAGQKDHIEVEYAAEYWFWKSK